MHIVVSSKKERDILIQLFTSLEKKEMNFFLDFKDPLSFQVESQRYRYISSSRKVFSQVELRFP